MEDERGGAGHKGGHEKGSSAESDKFAKNNEIIRKDLQQGAERKLGNSNRRTSRRFISRNKSPNPSIPLKFSLFVYLTKATKQALITFIDIPRLKSKKQKA